MRPLLAVLVAALSGMTGCTLSFNFHQCSYDDECKQLTDGQQPFCTTDNVCVKDPPPSRLCNVTYPEKPAQNAIALGAMMNLSGTAGDPADTERIQALRMGVDELNEQAQFTKSLRPVAVTFCDTSQAKNKTDLENMVKYLATDRKAAGIIGPMTSDRTRDVVAVVASLKVPMVTPSATAAGISSLPDQGFIFRVAPIEDLQSGPIAKEVPNNTSQTPVNLTVISVQSDYGEGLRQTFQDEWNKKNVNNVPKATPTYPDALSDAATQKVTAVIGAVQAQDPPPDVVYIIASRNVRPHGLTLLKAMKDLKTFIAPATGSKIWASDGVKSPELLQMAMDLSVPKLLFDNLEGIAPLSADRDSKSGNLTQSTSDFRNNWQGRFMNTTPLDFDPYIAYTYDTFYALALAVESVQGDVSGTQVAAALSLIRSLKSDKTFAIGPGSFAAFNNATANLKVGGEVAMRGVTGVLRFNQDGDRDISAGGAFERWSVVVNETGADPNRMRTVQLSSRTF